MGEQERPPKKKQKREKKALQDQEDEYDRDRFSSYSSREQISARKCALCGEGHEAGLKILKLMPHLAEDSDSSSSSDDEEDTGTDPRHKLLQKNEPGDPLHVWMSPHPLQMGKGRKYYVHRVCALFAPQTVRLRGVWYNVTKEIHRSRALKCRICQGGGACLGCSSKACRTSVHFPCAVRSGWEPSSFACSASPFYCTAHNDRYNEMESSADLESSCDIAKGREAVAITLALEGEAQFPKPYTHIRTDANIQPFTYIPTYIDSEDVIVPRTVTLDSINCCNCKDFCTDRLKCPCLQKRKSYSMKGTLLEFPRAITECNERCCCNKQACANRVVSRRFSTKLELSFCGRWGARTLEPIPNGSFVCEIAGQAVFAKRVQDEILNKNPLIIKLPSDEIGTDEFEPSEASWNSSSDADTRMQTNSQTNTHVNPNTDVQQPIPEPSTNSSFLLNGQQASPNLHLTSNAKENCEPNSVPVALVQKPSLHPNPVETSQQSQRRETLDNKPQQPLSIKDASTSINVPEANKSKPECIVISDSSSESSCESGNSDVVFVCERLGTPNRNSSSPVNHKQISSSSSSTNMQVPQLQPGLEFNPHDIWIDMRRYGNVSRFICPSSKPNLKTVLVFTDIQDERFPRLALFAVRDIAEGEELYRPLPS